MTLGSFEIWDVWTHPIKKQGNEMDEVFRPSLLVITSNPFVVSLLNFNPVFVFYFSHQFIIDFYLKIFSFDLCVWHKFRFIRWQWFCKMQEKLPALLVKSVLIWGPVLKFLESGNKKTVAFSADDFNWNSNSYGECLQNITKLWNSTYCDFLKMRSTK